MKEEQQQRRTSSYQSGQLFTQSNPSVVLTPTAVAVNLRRLCVFFVHNPIEQEISKRENRVKYRSLPGVSYKQAEVSKVGLKVLDDLLALNFGNNVADVCYRLLAAEGLHGTRFS